MLLDIVLRQCCSVLQHIHSLTPPIVHRDMKPENILLRNCATEIVLTDFGLAQQVERSYMTTRVGSLHYVAPECWKRHYTIAVDMWALGCIVYAACTGRVTADTARVMFSDARRKSFEQEIRCDLRQYGPKLVAIVLGLLKTNPNERLSSVQVLQMLDEPN
jgi:serine/threonine protein kinase